MLLKLLAELVKFDPQLPSLSFKVFNFILELKNFLLLLNEKLLLLSCTLGLLLVDLILLEDIGSGYGTLNILLVDALMRGVLS